MLGFGIRCLLAYLLGSLLGSLIVGRIAGGVDIRTQGSGNAGGTNALRTQGKVFALWVMLIDVGKGVTAVTLLPQLPLGFLGPDAVDPAWTCCSCGALAVVGHVYPVFFGFRGGKGAATFVGATSVLSPLAMLLGLLVWVFTLIVTGYVGLATVLAAWTVAVYALILAGPGAAISTFAFSMACFILYTHRSNIQRLLTGNENRFERAMLLRRRGD